MADDLRIACRRPRSDVGHRRDRRADEASLPARRREDQLLELGPAVRLGGDALGVRVGERIDRDPVAGLARGPAQELPGALGLGRERALEQAEREPARFEAVLAEQAVGDEQRAGWAGPCGWRRGSRGRPRPSAASGRRRSARCPGRPAVRPSRYSGSARRSKPRRQRRARTRPGRSSQVGQARRRGPPPRACGRRRTRWRGPSRAGGRVARLRARVSSVAASVASRSAPSVSTVSGVARAAGGTLPPYAKEPEAVALAQELALRSRRRPRTCPRRSPAPRPWPRR